MNWFRDQLIDLVLQPNEIEIPDSFALLSDVAFNILNIQNPVLVQDLLILFNKLIAQ